MPRMASWCINGRFQSIQALMDTSTYASVLAVMSCSPRERIIFTARSTCVAFGCRRCMRKNGAWPESALEACNSGCKRV
jgi:hypothetical protein